MKTIDDIVNDYAKMRSERDLWRKTAFRLGTMLGNWQGDDPTAIVVEAYEAVQAGCVCQLGQACPEHDDPTRD